MMHSGRVPVAPGLSTGALIAVVITAGAVFALFRPVPSMACASRQARLTLALGAAVGAASLAVVALLAVLAGPPVTDPADRLSLAGGFAVGFLASLALLTIGLLRLPGALPRQRAANVGHLVDGFVMAASAAAVCWTLGVEPVFSHHPHGADSARVAAAHLLFTGAAAVTALACGLAAVTVVRAASPRAPLGTAAVGVGVTGPSGTALIVAIWAGSGTAALGCAVGYAAGLLATALGGRRNGGTVPARASRAGALPLGAAAVAIGAQLLRLAVFGPADNATVTLAALVAGALAVRQAAVLRDLRRYGDEAVARELRFRTMAHTDALTGLANRRRLVQVLRQDAVGGPPCVLLAIDLDGFKDVNDVRGHDVGDAVLVEVARRLSATLRPGESAVRLGGDEFAVLLWEGATGAEARAGEILAALARPYEVTVGPVYLSASIGMASCGTTTTVEGLLHNADLALRFAKKRGKNRVEHYDAADDQWLRRRTAIEEALRGAAERGELSLAYQPVVALDEGRTVGVEALVRWRHPTLGSVPPAEFVPVAEEVGLIGELDGWVLREACRQLSRWLAEGYDLWVSVNISVRELHLPGYISQVVDAFVDHGVPPDRLILEVTEHAVAVDVEQMIGRLAALRAVGVRVALDDFGAGYSSLGQLRRLPVDVLKADQSLLVELPRPAPPGTTPLVDVVVRLGQALGLEVITEGVAEPAQRDVVVASGCRLAQGELLGAPMPAERVEAVLASWTPDRPLPAPRRLRRKAEST